MFKTQSCPEKRQQLKLHQCWFLVQKSLLLLFLFQSLCNCSHNNHILLSYKIHNKCHYLIYVAKSMLNVLFHCNCICVLYCVYRRGAIFPPTFEFHSLSAGLKCNCKRLEFCSNATVTSFHSRKFRSMYESILSTMKSINGLVQQLGN